jgi:endogenous inhibitor of DNA gyrase (YacG/DUF329 family)
MFKEFDLVEVPCPICERWIPIESDFPEVFLESEAMTEVSCPHCGQTVSIVPKTGRRVYRRAGE